MCKVIAICGKICSGKSYYANQIKESENAVILSCDEITNILFDNNLGDKHDEMTKRIREYLLTKTVDIISTNTNVILDWGFWSKKDRDYVKEYFRSKSIECEMHYVCIDNASWQKNITERNEKVLLGDSGSDYYLDDGLLKKLLSMWQEPSKEEIDIWFNLKR